MKENNRIVSVGTESEMDLTAKELNMIDDFKEVMNGVNNEIANDYGFLEIDRDILDKIALSTALNYKKMNFEYSEIDEKLFDDFTFEFMLKFFGDIEEDELIKYLVYIGEESYELNDREKIFYKIVDTLDTIADIKITDQNKIEKEVGMCIGEDNYITYCIDEDLIKFYIKDEEELVINKNSPLLYMLDTLFYEVHEE
ncbi:TPA: hypothetical protein ACMU4L_003565 [Clostridioides difficile]|uniref:hypothetical protein n=1 Tax=Clostridioides difficile TaxID=1496 RepID=UPI000309FD7C|nr:hypothetical protein [Clostridioides difficile]EQE05981.1 hypothetical protein QAS_1271 [Clostridioides difficile CD9]EQE13537.1 hypothetical protein QAQ_1234 [Clostridioides difficile CD8]EQI99057.1 hypothetical protein QQQ_1215 [Clostridioides difficile P5]EQJ82389.1 hypothetical protein QU7_1266 [Clostridioides difficile P46]EQJ84738.1 hypothetical protein QU9_1632 [Clostridioides difficile P48]